MRRASSSVAGSTRRSSRQPSLLKPASSVLKTCAGTYKAYVERAALVRMLRVHKIQQDLDTKWPHSSGLLLKAGVIGLQECIIHTESGKREMMRETAGAHKVEGVGHSGAHGLRLRHRCGHLGVYDALRSACNKVSKCHPTQVCGPISYMLPCPSHAHKDVHLLSALQPARQAPQTCLKPPRACQQPPQTEGKETHPSSLLLGSLVQGISPSSAACLAQALQDLQAKRLPVERDCRTLPRSWRVSV